MRISAVTQQFHAELRKVNNARRTERSDKNNRTTRTDRSDVSADAQSLSEVKAHFDTIAANLSVHPDVRAEKISEVREKINNGFYNSEEFIEKLADKLLAEFGMKLP